MSDSFTETETQGWFSRLTESIKSVAGGLLLFVLAFPLLFWNEGRAVQTYKSLAEGASAVIAIAADKIDAANDGKLVHTTGEVKTGSSLKDPLFGISAPALKLNRKAEMYQWVETKKTKSKKKAGGKKVKTTTYTYAKEWSTKAHNSSKFKKKKKHYNPDFNYKSDSWVASDATLGAFSLPSSLVRKIHSSEKLAVDDKQLMTLPSELRGRAKISNGGIYIGDSSSDPDVGDMRFSFEMTPATTVSIVAQQAKSSFTGYQTSAGDTLEMLKEGTVGADTMFKAAADANATMTWILRAVGFFMMMIGIGMVFKPLVVVADVIPILGDILGMGVSLLAFAIAAPLTFITISVAWIFHRPVVGILLLLLGVGIIVGIKTLAAKKKAAAGATPAPA